MIQQLNENIRVEPLSLIHSSSIFETIDKHRNELREWLPFVDSTKEKKDIINFINFSNADIHFPIFYDNSFAGLIGIKDIDQDNRKAEIGYWISPEFQNKGIVTLVSQWLIRYAFNKLGINRLQIRVAVDNRKSIRVAEKLKFKFEGIQRDGELLVSGFTDLNVYSLLKRENEFNL